VKLGELRCDPARPPRNGRARGGRCSGQRRWIALPGLVPLAAVSKTGGGRSRQTADRRC